MPNHEKFTEEDLRIDPMTIARLFNTVSFSSKDTKISTKTLHLVSEYIRLFTTEAIIRANEERMEERERDSNRYNVGSAGDENEVLDNENVLETRHLEAIAGLLTLDF